MTTPSSSVHPQALAERRGEDASTGSALVSLVHKQLAALESLAAEGYAEVSALHGEMADLTGRLNATVGRMARLEAMLHSHERMLGAIRAGLLEIPPPRQPQQLPNGVQPTAAPPEAVRPVAIPAASASHISPAAEPPRSPAPVSSPIPPIAPKPAAPEPPPRLSATAAISEPPHPDPAPKETSVIETPADNRPQVQRGSTVEVVFDDNSSETYTLVRPDEANPTRNLIGDNTPLGMALLGACVGDVRHYRVRTNGPEQVVRVREIV